MSIKLPRCCQTILSIKLNIVKKNAPATFQRIIQQILGDLLYKRVINYLDHFIIYSETFEDHIKLLKKILKKFLEYGIKLKLSKFYFIKEEIEYLGHAISHNCVRPALFKANAVLMFPTSQNVIELFRFFGTLGYYRRFIKNFSSIAAPLYCSSYVFCLYIFNFQFLPFIYSIN